jgi:hypothetical protein
MVKGGRIQREEARVKVCLCRAVQIVDKTRVKQVLERIGLSPRTERQQSVTVANRLGIGRGIVQTESTGHPRLQI